MEFLNFSTIAGLLRKFNLTYFPKGVPEGPDARQEQFNKFPEEQLEADIEEMDKKFWNVSDDLENALLEQDSGKPLNESKTTTINFDKLVPGKKKAVPLSISDVKAEENRQQRICKFKS